MSHQCPCVNAVYAVYRAIGKVNNSKKPRNVLLIESYCIRSTALRLRDGTNYRNICNFVSRFTAIFLVGGLGVEDQTASARPRTSSTRFSLLCLGQRESLSIKTKNIRLTGTSNSRHFCFCASWLLTEKRRVWVFQVAELCARRCGLRRNPANIQELQQHSIPSGRYIHLTVCIYSTITCRWNSLLTHTAAVTHLSIGDSSHKH
jgi:hypothetical protein